MNNLLIVALFAAMAATAGVLLVGIVGFLRGSEFSARHGNTLMRARVSLQMIAVMILGLLFMMNG